MTEEIHTPKPLVIDERAKLVTDIEKTFAPPPINLPNKKRRVLDHCCSRLTASGLPGADLAVEYLHAKYTKNLSVNTIKQAGRIVLYFLRFLARDGTTIYTLNRQHISAYVAYEQDRGLKAQSVVNHLRALYAFIVFLVNQGVLPHAILQNKIRFKWGPLQ